VCTTEVSLSTTGLVTMVQTYLPKPRCVRVISALRGNWCDIHASIDQYAGKNFNSLTKPHLICQYTTSWTLDCNGLLSHHTTDNTPSQTLQQSYQAPSHQPLEFLAQWPCYQPRPGHKPGPAAVTSQPP